MQKQINTMQQRTC